METLNYYSGFLSTFMALIVAGFGLKLALEEKSNRTYQIGDKEYNRQKVHTAITLGFLGVVIQVVSDTMKGLDGSQLLLDEKIIGAYAFALSVLVMKK
ncbi:MAG: hypothetical protein ACSHWU_13620 [Marinicella sp.]